MKKTGDTEKYTQTWVDLYNKGMSIRAIATEYKIGKTVIQRAIKPYTAIREKSPNLKYAEEWYNLYLTGLSKAEIARQYGVSAQVVGSVLVTVGVEKEPKIDFKYEHLEEIFIELYKNGSSLKEIGDKFGIDKQTILNYLRRNEVPIRDLSEAGRTIPFNEDYFKELNSENLFVLGMVYRVGNIIYDNQKPRNLILISNREKNIHYILEKLERNRVKERPLFEGVYEYEPIHSINLVSRLIELGFHSSSNYEFPELTESEMDIFIEGYMYADLDFGKKQHIFQFSFPSPKSKEKVLDYFEKKDFFTRKEIREETDTSFTIENKPFYEKANGYYPELHLKYE